MTSDSPSEKQPLPTQDPASQLKAGVVGFKASRIDGVEHLTGPHSDLSSRKKNLAGVTNVYQLGGHKSRGLTGVHGNLPERMNDKRVEHGSGQNLLPSLQKLKILQELNKFLDDLSLRIQDLEARESFVSHSLLLLDHERRQFRLWKSIELHELEHQKQEWRLSNYSDPITQAQTILSQQDQAVMQELKAAAGEEPGQAVQPSDIYATCEVQLVKEVLDHTNKPSSVIDQERIYLLDIEDDFAADEQVIAPSVVNLPEEIFEPINISVNEFKSVIPVVDVLDHQPEIALEEIKIEFHHEDTNEILTGPAVSIIPEVQESSDQLLVPPPEAVLPAMTGTEREEFLLQQQEWEALREQQLEDLERRQKLSLKQIRFQKEHLEKLRREYELERNASFHELQQWQTRLASSAQILGLQQQQYQQARELLDERTESLLREESILRELMKLSNEQHSQAEVEVEYIFSLEERLKSTLQTQEAEFKRQEEHLLHLISNFVPKQKQLVQMQIETEQAHRETLLIREALRHAWQQVKGDVQFPELEQAYKTHKETLEVITEGNLWRLIKELEGISGHNREILIQLEEGLRTSLEVLSTIRQELPLLIPPVSDLKAESYEQQLSERQQWLEEKLEAERIIRHLVDQLEVRIIQQQGSLPENNRQTNAA